MTGSEAIAGFQQRPPEVLGGVVVVVQMDLDLTVARAAEPGQGVEVLGIVLLDGVEERVARRPSIAVAKLLEPLGIMADPFLDAHPSDFLVDISRLGLEVVGDADQDVDRAVGTTEPVTALEQVGHEPAVQRSLAKLADPEQEKQGTERDEYQQSGPPIHSNDTTQG